MHIFDTDSFTHWQKKNPNILSKIEKHDFVAINYSYKVEILRGRIDFLLKAENPENLEKAQRLLLKAKNSFQNFPIINFNKEALIKFDEFRQNSKFRKIGRNDLLIASICLANRAILVTRNVKHFKQFPNLAVKNWID